MLRASLLQMSIQHQEVSLREARWVSLHKMCEGLAHYRTKGAVVGQALQQHHGVVPFSKVWPPPSYLGAWLMVILEAWLSRCNAMELMMYVQHEQTFSDHNSRC